MKQLYHYDCEFSEILIHQSIGLITFKIRVSLMFFSREFLHSKDRWITIFLISLVITICSNILHISSISPTEELEKSLRKPLKLASLIKYYGNQKNLLRFFAIVENQLIQRGFYKFEID